MELPHYSPEVRNGFLGIKALCLEIILGAVAVLHIHLEDVRMNMKSLTTIVIASAFIAACAKDEPAPAPAPVYEEPVVEAPAPAPYVEPVVEYDPMTDLTQNGLDSISADTVHFDYDSSELTSAARSILEGQAQWMGGNNLNISIEGHADERGTREYNLALGERRAVAVKNYLVALGVSASRLETISYGKERPVAVGNSEEAWGQNRRGETVVK